MKRHLPALFLFALHLAACASAADEIQTAAGSVFRGEVIRASDGKIQLKTAAAGRILIDLKKITRLKTESRLTVVLADGTVLTGTLTATAPDQASVVSDQGQASAPFALPDVRFISKAASRWQGFLEASGQLKDGSQQVTQGSLGFEIIRETATDQLSFRGLINYSETDDQLTSRNSFGAVKYDTKFSDSLYGYLNAEALSDEFQDLNLRTVYGAGVGYRIDSIPRVRLSLEGGAAYLDEAFEVNSAQDDRRVTARVAVQAKWKLSRNLAFSEEVTVYPSLEDDKIQARNEAFVAFKLSARWSLRVGHIYTFSSDPPSGFAKTDNLALITFRLTF